MVAGEVVIVAGEVVIAEVVASFFLPHLRPPLLAFCFSGASMNPKDFRSLAHELVDWMADYVEQAGAHPVIPNTQPGDIRKQLPTSAPQEAEPFAQIFADFERTVVPGMTHWNHPGWFAYFPANHSPPSILAEMLTATLGAQCMSWQTSPAATELEQVVLDWLRQMLGLSESWVGSIQDTASSATLVALLSAREQATQHQYGLEGASADNADRLVVYASTEAHSSIDKGVKLAGYGLNRLRSIPTDENFAMDPNALEAAIQKDLAAGLQPACVVACVGTTSSTGLDPLEAIGTLCKQHNIWLHIDAAYAGAAAILPEHRYILDGVEYADSFVFNPHKWLFTNFDCSAYYVRDVETLLRTFRSDPEYLKTVYDPQVVNFRDWGIPLGRRFRALKLWFVLRSYGVKGLQEHIRNHIAWAQELGEWVEASSNFELLAPVPLGLVCLRFHPPSIQDVETLNTLNEALLTKVNQDPRFHLTHTKLRGRYTLRVSIGQLYTTRQHVVDLWNLLQTTADEQS